jgi:hypothetical protein
MMNWPERRHRHQHHILPLKELTARFPIFVLRSRGVQFPIACVYHLADHFDVPDLQGCSIRLRKESIDVTNQTSSNFEEMLIDEIAEAVRTDEHVWSGPAIVAMTFIDRGPGHYLLFKLNDVAGCQTEIEWLRQRIDVLEKRVEDLFIYDGHYQ